MSRRNGGSAIRVLLVAASAVRRAGLEILLKNAPGMKLAASLQNTRNVASHVAELQPDVLLADFDSDSAFPPSSLASVALVEEPDVHWIAQALLSGVKAILPRDAELPEIITAIQAAYNGFLLLSPEFAQGLLAHVRPSAGPADAPLDDLTPREVEILRLLAEGSPNREIAAQLGISDHTVKFHISSILNKLDASSRTEAVTVGIRNGLIVI
jgi:DNA-binding NarL/FixJ family response regulator